MLKLLRDAQICVASRDDCVQLQRPDRLADGSRNGGSQLRKLLSTPVETHLMRPRATQMSP